MQSKTQVNILNFCLRLCIPLLSFLLSLTMPHHPADQFSHSKNPYKQTHGSKASQSGNEVEEPQISWSQVNAMEEKARKEKEQDEPILSANARRLSDAIKQRQKSL
ncbi:hypothetical protein BGW37DRAFT_228149 [Umbelopsis sp. PMI_123]|nr:hypothetical protein BGW37DRAFT_228149 [Umbelopsis sp. PMI_123]